MKIACICSTKNEGDIIEAFVRLNGRICNSFFFVDDSTDNTREILGLLATEGYEINFLTSSEGGYNQPRPTKACLSAVMRTANPDWVFLLDADEFIVAPDKEKLLREMQDVPPNTFLVAEWKTYVPTRLGYFDSRSPLTECFGLRKDRGEVFKKVSLPGKIIDHVMTTAGNHTAQSLSETPVREQAAATYHLAHFPVRSSEQIIVKNLLATHNLRTRVDSLGGEGFHVFPIFQTIRHRNYKLTLEDLASIALTYAYTDQTPRPSDRDDLDLRENPNLKTELLYFQLARIEPLARLDFEIERLSAEARRKKEHTPFNATYLQARRDS